MRIFGAAKGNQNPGKEALSLNALMKEYPNIKQILDDLGVPIKENSSHSLAYLCDEAGVDVNEIFDILEGKTSSQIINNVKIDSLTIIPGTTKNGKPELFENITINKGEIVALVGPTGSGKSQFLNDIEGLAQGDSPSCRKILLNNSEIDEEIRFNQAHKPIAQISQNMNYLLDISVEEFIEIHFESKGKGVSKKSKNEILGVACSLSGEPFTLETPLVSLSGGQTRALMIADAVKISKSPVILVDEIENAGIDKSVAVNLLLKENNITFIATHDPLIALMAHKRVVLKNGGINCIIYRSESEKEVLKNLEKIDKTLSIVKQKLRIGQLLNIDDLTD